MSSTPLPAGLRRRTCLLAAAAAPLAAQANLALLLRLITFGMRSGAGRGLAGAALRAGAARGAATAAAAATRGAAARGAAAAARTASIGRGAAAALPAAGARAAGTTRLASAMRPARRLGAGMAAAQSGSVSAVDLAMLAHDASALLGSGALPPEVQVAEPIDLLQVEIDGLNLTDQHLNGALSLLLFDAAFAAGGEGRFHRVLLGLAVAAPRTALQFGHDFDVTDWGDERLYIAPTLTTPAADETDRSVAFEPPLLIVDFQKG